MTFSNDIKCIFLSEFDPIAGPVVVHQVPEDFPIRDEFDAVHDLIITKPQLYNRLITVDVGGYRIVGCPKSIEDKKYARNALIFNIVFVFSEDAEIAVFEPVVQKLGDAFKTYELESSFLSSNGEKIRIPQILSKIRYNLNTCGICIIPIDSTNTLRLKIMPVLESVPAVHDHHVPVFITSDEELNNVNWDITIQEILLHIDGVNHVARIAEQSEVDINNVKESIQHLVVYNFVKLINIFQYSSVYVPTPKLPLLLKDKILQRKCVEHISLPGQEALLSDTFRLLCSLEAGLAVRDMCLRSNPNSINIDERKLVQFAVMHGLIRQLHKYPVETITTDPSAPPLESPILQYCDGNRNYDEICCLLNLSHQELDEEIDKLQDVIVCWK